MRAGRGLGGLQRGHAASGLRASAGGPRPGEIGIQHDGRSKRADEYRTVPFDLVVTVCDDAAENCPMWLGQGKRVHLGFPDPAKATGAEEEVLAVFRTVRDDIAYQVMELLALAWQVG